MNYLTLAIGVIVGAALMVAPAYLTGKRTGKAEIAVALQGVRITILKDGQKIDEKAFAADDVDLCLLLGGCMQPDGKVD
jgi:hypothetical protein